MRKMPEGFPWVSREEFEADLVSAWDKMKEEGIRRGHLVKQKDGSLRGVSHPDKWFNDSEEN